MELDALKSQLKEKLATDHANRSDADLRELLKRKTNSVIAKLKRSLRFEIISAIIITLGFAWVGIASSYRAFRIYFSVFAVVSVLFVFLLFYLLRRTKELGDTVLPVKSNLQTLVSILNEFQRRYFQFTMALIPICFIFSFILGYQEEKPIPAMEKMAHRLFSEQWQVIVFFITYMAALAVGAYYFTKWYLRKLYGKYVSELKACIAELSFEA